MDRYSRGLLTLVLLCRMYLIKQVPDDPKLLEMCFDCSNFQYQLKDAKKPVEDHIFQTIFLNKKDKETWTIDEIKEDKISKPGLGRAVLENSI